MKKLHRVNEKTEKSRKKQPRISEKIDRERKKKNPIN